MMFRKTGLIGSSVIDLDVKGDDRGFFARVFCDDEFRRACLPLDIVQVNTTWSARAGTLRGMHYQLQPAAEIKVVRCVRGAIWDCILDLRPDSKTFGRWFGEVLSAQNRRMMYVPKGCAHGLITLTDDVEIFYFMGAAYAPEYERGVRWNDPYFAIAWPSQPIELSEKDAAWPAFDPVFHGVETFRGLGTSEE
ncbi:dTDP-4-dehydrorhamnose 3,5-epimerase [Rhizobium sp. BR 362]|uniref:dTDP-4-dehydrorhamnose 3,5-epimerase n=1 Tax=Rhizobium sp. BR 362 TaxID=3040670 RepID=UPI002F4083A7